MTGFRSYFHCPLKECREQINSIAIKNYQSGSPTPPGLPRATSAIKLVKNLQGIKVYQYIVNVRAVLSQSRQVDKIQSLV